MCNQLTKNFWPQEVLLRDESLVHDEEEKKKKVKNLYIVKFCRLYAFLHHSEISSECVQTTIQRVITIYLQQKFWPKEAFWRDKNFVEDKKDIEEYRQS